VTQYQGNGSARPRIDLETVRETLSYMQDDMRRSPDLARVCRALEDALREIDAVRSSPRPGAIPAARGARIPRLDLVPWRPAR
jgi:hypothetical protein